jgi:DNA-binding response OmpR family regulator
MNSENTSKRSYVAPRLQKLDADSVASLQLNPAQPNSGGTPLRALVVARDPQLTEIVSVALAKFNIAASYCDSGASASQRLQTEKFEAVVLDFDGLSDSLPGVKALRESRSNRNCVVLAVASDTDSKRRAFAQGTSFVFERPLSQARVVQVVRTAYGLMLRDRREYFRLAVELPVRLQRGTGPELGCTTINLSRSGIALRNAPTMEAGETVQLIFVLPEKDSPVRAQGKVIWDDRHGKAGLSLEFSNPDVQVGLVTWLDEHFYQQFDIPNNRE